MGKKRSETSTQRLLRAVEECDACLCKNFPPEFIIGLRGAIDSGLSCEQIVAFLVLATGWYEACCRLPGDELVRRACNLSEVMAGDVGVESLKRWNLRKLARERKKTKKLRWSIATGSRSHDLAGR